MRALVTLVGQGIKPRSEIIAYFQSLFREKLERTCSGVWNDLVLCSCDLYPGELIDDIERAYDDGLVDSFIASPEDIQDMLQETSDVRLEKLGTDPYHQLIDDTIEELESWACFHDVDRSFHREWQAISSITDEEVGIAEPVRVGHKIGRNDPCPCGSGKKYKKCCGRDV